MSKRSASHTPLKAGVKKGKPKRKTGDYQSGRELLKPKLGIELKAFDVSRTNLQLNNIAGPPIFVDLNVPINGAELYQRVGRKV